MLAVSPPRGGRRRYPANDSRRLQYARLHPPSPRSGAFVVGLSARRGFGRMQTKRKGCSPNPCIHWILHQAFLDLRQFNRLPVSPCVAKQECAAGGDWRRSAPLAAHMGRRAAFAIPSSPRGWRFVVGLSARPGSGGCKRAGKVTGACQSPLRNHEYLLSNPLALNGASSLPLCSGAGVRSGQGLLCWYLCHRLTQKGLCSASYVALCPTVT